MTQRLQQTYKELEIEKQLTDKLVYSILPPSVANELRLGNAVEAVKYDMVTMLFSGLCDFDMICQRNSPLEIVNLLNDLYTKFDMLADPKINNVYKVRNRLSLSCFIKVQHFSVDSKDVLRVSHTTPVYIPTSTKSTNQIN
jgi:hypothetical protein